MGVHSLWKVLEPFKQTRSLLLLSEEHRTRAQSSRVEGDGATLRIGVDMGTCMAECNAGAKAAGVNNQRAGAGLYLFYKRLTEFIKAPVALVFVLDGPARPNYKRGHRVRPQSIWWTDLAIELVDHFGFQIHHAPGEAEAELAKLNIEGYIDAVITSDSDAYLFGTKTLLRSIPKKDRKRDRKDLDEYDVYIASEEGLPINKDGLILFALLSGGDYGPGISGCGPTTALALAKCGFGDQLLAAHYQLNDTEYERFLIQWRCAIRTELHTNSRGLLPRRQPNVAAAISDNFPNRRILRLYATPVTSWSPGRIPPDANQWSFKQPSISGITEFCRQNFRCVEPQKVKEKFKSTLWEGIFLQMLYSASATYIPQEHRLQLPDSRHADILKISYQKRRGQFEHIFGTEPQPKLVISTTDFVNSMGPNFTGSTADQITVWVRASLLPPPLYLEINEKVSYNLMLKDYCRPLI
ncbi:PIN domain-like protein [Pholiota molesta]|nr:PIN domain-like protein [Pholiota molesta]